MEETINHEMIYESEDEDEYLSEKEFIELVILFIRLIVLILIIVLLFILMEKIS